MGAGAGKLLSGIVQRYQAPLGPVFIPGSRGANGFIQQTIVQAATINLEFRSGNHGIVTLTTNAAFVIGAPTFSATAMSAIAPFTLWGGLRLRYTIKNTSGGAHGAGTFAAIFKVSANWSATATANNRTMEFEWDGTNWVEQWRTAADVAN